MATRIAQIDELRENLHHHWWQFPPQTVVAAQRKVYNIFSQSFCTITRNVIRSSNVGTCKVCGEKRTFHPRNDSRWD